MVQASVKCIAKNKEQFILTDTEVIQGKVLNHAVSDQSGGLES